jgi:RNA-directed DNA polymerase
MVTFLTASALHEIRLRTDVDYFSRHVLGVSYASLRGLIYPEPRYRAFVISKRSGGHRIVNEPKRRLKLIQLRVLSFLNLKASASKPCVHGFVKGRSIVTNAMQHLESRPHHLLNLDLEDFFPTINFYRVRGVFRKAPFFLEHEVATVLAQVCTYRNALPQGAPTSPALSNLVCRSLDRDLIGLARRHRATYTRYADDISFSFSVRDAQNLPSNICAFDSGSITLGHEIRGIIQDQHHFRINDRKTRMSTRRSRMEVTGIAINESLNVRREFIDRIRGALHAWEKHGYTSAQAAWQSRVVAGQTQAYELRPWRRQTRTGAIPALKRVLWGKLLYVRMVRGKDDAVYTRLAERFNRLVQQERQSTADFESPLLPVELIVRDSADAERAVFVVEWMGDYQPSGASHPTMVCGQGTAFAYRDATTLVTCDHVLQWTGQIDGVNTVVDWESTSLISKSMTVISPTTNVSVSVSIAARDPGRDLAVLRVAVPSPIERHFVGLEVPLNRNEDGWLIGFPNWSPGRVANQAGATVLSRYPRSALRRFEVSTSVRQGNSGGPYVDTLYRVAGVAQQGATQQGGNDECLCVTELDSWLNSLP